MPLPHFIYVNCMYSKPQRFIISVKKMYLFNIAAYYVVDGHYIQCRTNVLSIISRRVSCYMIDINVETIILNNTNFVAY